MGCDLDSRIQYTEFSMVIKKQKEVSSTKLYVTDSQSSCGNTLVFNLGAFAFPCVFYYLFIMQKQNCGSQKKQS